MDQVLRILLSNALKFTPAGGSITIRIILLDKFSYSTFGSNSDLISLGASSSSVQQNSSRFVTKNGSADLRAAEQSRGNVTVSPTLRSEDARRPSSQNSFPLISVSPAQTFRSNIDGGPLRITRDSHDSELDSTESSPFLASDHRVSITGVSAFRKATVAARLAVESSAATPSLHELGNDNNSSKSKKSIYPRVVRFEVIDTGHGVPLHLQKELFKEYVQIDAARQQHGGGSGLGLSIAKSIIEMHEGVIGMTSEGAGKGSTFFFELPGFIDDCASDHDAKSHRSMNDLSKAASSSRKPSSDPRSSRQAYVPVSRPKSFPVSISELMQRSFSFGKIEPDMIEPDIEVGTIQNDDSPITHKNLQANAAIVQGSFSTTVQGSFSTNSSEPENYIQNLKLHFLVVDDAISNRKILGRIIERLGHTYDECDDGVDAVECISIVLGSGKSQSNLLDERLERTSFGYRMKTTANKVRELESGSGQTLNDATLKTDVGKYDAIFLDWNMPRMNGLDACLAIRKLGYTGFIFGVTGNCSVEEINEFISMGANSVIPKPISIRLFKEIVMEHFAKYK